MQIHPHGHGSQLLRNPPRAGRPCRPVLNLAHRSGGLVLALFVLGGLAQAATTKTENVFLVTADGLRWQEVFTGAEEILMSKEYGNVGDSDTNALRAQFWRPTAEARREALFPFLWGTVAKR